MKKGLSIVAIAILVLLAVYLAWDRYLSVDHPQALVATEDALATGGVVALGSIDIAHAVRLESAFLGRPDTANSDPNLLTDSLYSHLYAAGIDPRADLQQLVLALYLDADQAPGYAVAALGRFDKDKVLRGLQDGYEVTPAPDVHPEAWRVLKQNPDTCDWSPPMILTVRPDLILAANPTRFPALITRLDAQSAAQHSLERWRGFRDGKLGSLALVVPEDTPDTGNVLLQQPLREAHDELAAFQEVYFGVGVWPLPFRANLELMLAGDGSGVAHDTAARWQSVVSTSKQHWSQSMPTLARLHDAISVDADQNTLSMKASVDEAWFEDAAKIPQELFGLLFDDSTMRFGSPNGGSNPQERIDENPATFLAELSPDALQTYHPNPPFIPKADAVSGPFGLQLTAVELGDEDDEGLTLTVSATHTGIPNLGSGNERVQLYVESVTDPSGRELLRAETCGTERNGLPAPVATPHFEQSLRGEKTVRLKAGTPHADVQRIRGRVALRLPTRTETIRIASLDQEQAIEREGLRITLRRTAADTLQYKVYGDSRRLLAVRGLNQDAQPLSQSSSMSGAFLFGEGLSKTQAFSGRVATADLVLAVEDVDKTFPFELSRSRPRNSQSTAPHPPVSVQPYGLAQLHREFQQAPPLPEDGNDIQASASTGPFLITLDSMRTFIGLQTRLSIYSPPVPGLTENLGGLAIELIAIENAKGENLIENDVQTESVNLHADWQDRSRLQGQANLGFETRADESEIRKLKGRVHLGLPTKTQAYSLPDVTVGSRVDAGGSTIILTRVDDKGFRLDFGKKHPPLVAVNAYNEAGESIWVPNPSLDVKDGHWVGHFNTHGDFSRIEVLLAKEQERERFDFELVPREG